MSYLTKVSDAPIAAKRTFTDFLHHVGAVEGESHHRGDSIGSVVGAAAGALAVPSHRILGGIGGYTLGRNLPALLSSEHRGSALCNMVTTAGGVFGSLAGERYGRPIVGFIIGYLATGAAVYYGGFRR